MSTTIKDLQTRLATLKKERDALNLEKVKQRHAHAENEFQKYDSSAHVGDDLSFARAANDVMTAKVNAQTDLSLATHEHSGLTRQINSIEVPLNAGKRIATAQSVIKSTAQRVTLAKATAAKANASLRTIAAMVVAESAAFDKERSDTSAALLAAVKAGQAAPQVRPASREKLSTLERAQIAAQAELDAADSEVTAAGEASRDAAQELSEAHADATALTLMLIRTDYADALYNHSKAYRNAYRRDYPADDVAGAVNRRIRMDA